MTPDHPRSRGVYVSSRTSTSGGIGSSPLARGLPRSRRASCRARRIIPARAGFTTPGPGVRGRSGDHPRSRGVYVGGTAEGFTRRGSSPLARGLPDRPEGAGVVGRIIPARAGFTAARAAAPGLVWDHPRSRGVYAERPDDDAYARRIIPARAGFTPLLSTFIPPCPDHPRSRGVYHAPCVRASDFAGSSPLARGLRALCGVGHKAYGDHPRSRGVYDFQCAQ